jgi:hypothetical protein
VTEGHLLIIPNRHVADYFLVTPDGHDHEHEHGIPEDRAKPSIHAADRCGFAQLRKRESRGVREQTQDGSPALLSDLWERPL